jgi:transposase
MLDAADLPDDVAALKAMLIAAQAREVRKDDRIERLEKLAQHSSRQLSGANPRRLIPSNSISHWRTWRQP